MNTCPQCHSVYADDFVYCLQCGTLLTAGVEQETMVRPKFNEAGVSGPMMACTGCGHENRAGSKFCKTCGETIAAEPAGGWPGQAFGLGVAATPAFDARGYQETINVGPGVFVPPAMMPPVAPAAATNRVLLFVGGGLALGLVLLIGLVWLIDRPPPPNNNNGRNPANNTNNTADSTLPRNFERAYKGWVRNPRKGTDIELTMSLKRTGEELTGWVTTNRKTDEVRGKIEDNGQFDLTAFENGQRHTGYWSGRILTDGTIENGQWMDEYKSESTTYTALQQ